MDKHYQPKKIEKKIYNLWEKEGFFNPDKLGKNYKKKYSIVIPPPNITGSLHIGHALNIVIQDILIRWKRMQGLKTLWVPGIDHAGIATQNVVEKTLRKENKTRFDLGREEFVKKIWQWKEKYDISILKQLKQIGVSCDWSRTRFTMDKNYTKAVQQAFLHYYKKGWVFHDKRTINWCPRCQTSLSDLELEYKEEEGKLWFIRYKVKNRNSKTKKYMVVATTRPETMLGDTAVAVNPKDKRYKNLIGKSVILPIVNREIPIISDRIVDPKFGTGAVKITPAHSIVDYQIAKRQGLGMIQVIDENGRISQNAPLLYQGLKIKQAREKVVEELKKINLIEKIIDYPHSVPVCYRCDSLVESIPSKQWFLKMDKLSQLAIDSVKKGKVKFHPRRWEKVYFDWLKNMQDWCISRQIWWGHQLPIFFCQKKQKEYFISLESPKKCLICGECKPQQSTDVFDTWFSSALWPFAVLGWPAKTKDLKEFYPTNVLSTDRGIINLWVTRMIFSAQEFTGKNPFQDVIIHATVLTKAGKRMSKSLGTGIDPIDLIDKYGADALRFGLAWQISKRQDICFNEDNIIAGKKFCNKIWNASRFVLANKPSLINADKKLINADKNLTAADKRILTGLEKTIKLINKDLEYFQFGRVIQRIYRFFWHNFCDIYIEKSKIQIKNSKSVKEAENTKKILFYVFLNCLTILHPFMPFITEEIYQILPIENKKRALIIEKWPKISLKNLITH
ncbi:MAG: valine--tRNA ligase [Candidatus Pacebacteria bacterium]|nr:valine--tRNA ligase [Candidatus Paceibacterota bacterium]